MVSLTVIIIVTFAVAAYGHECKDFKLSASDQSVIDMMKHYLHTSRKTEFSDRKQNVGVIYTRWGKKTCPEAVDLVYSGQVGGNEHQNKGGSSNYLCLPNDPDNGKPYSYANDVLYGAEYQTGSSAKPSGLDNLNKKDVPCAVCRRAGMSTILMIPGKQTCYNGWKAEYTGFLMTEHKSHNNKDYVCMDKDAEPLDNDSTDKNGALLYAVRTTCGSLRCPPYKNHTEMMCAVCTM